MGGMPSSWAGNDLSSLLQMTLPTKYIVVGAVNKQRCENIDQYVTGVESAISVDGVIWQTVIKHADVIYHVYNGQLSLSSWI